MDAETIKQRLNLSPLTFEGGYFRETYRSSVDIPTDHLPERYGSRRSAGTAIYYLLDTTTFSGLHRLKSDETYHFYQGDPVQMLLLPPTGSARTLTLGSDLLQGHEPQFTVPAGVWQGSRLIPGGKVALMGTTMSPGFDRDDFESATGVNLAARYPEHAALITALTR